jgi:hypothetical protein
MLVDMNRIPILAPTGNSTIWQATTAASFALLGILGGPFIGALGGLLRDGTFAVVSGAAHPYLISSVWALLWGADILEDVVLGLVPGIAARYTRRIDILAGVSAATAWLSLPCMLTADAIIVGQPDRIGHVLITMTGNWDQPVDPGLAVYGFLTGAIVALALTLWSKPRKTALRVVAILGLAAVVLMELGAHT